MKKIFLFIIIFQSLAVWAQKKTETKQNMKSPIGVVAVNQVYRGTAPDELSLEIADAISQAGVGWVRLRINWYLAERQLGVYDWTQTDSSINAYYNRGLSIFVTLQGGNHLYDTLTLYPADSFPYPPAGLPPIYTPQAINGWQNFLSEVITRYKDKVKYWSIQNEPNIQENWQPSPDPFEYLEFVKITAPYIKSIDSSAKIIAGNTSMIDFGFLNSIIDSLVQYIDYLGFHPYRLYPEDDQDDFIIASMIIDTTSILKTYEQEVDSLVTLLRKSDTLGKVKLWNEEVGYPSLPEPLLWEYVHTCDIVQVKNVLRKYLLDFACGVYVSTYWGDYDAHSQTYNMLGENWINDFYDMTLTDWYEKEQLIFFPSIALTYSTPYTIVSKQATDYDTLIGNIFSTIDYIFYPDTCPDIPDFNNQAVYTFNIPEAGKYTVWGHMRNPDTAKVPVWIGALDMNYFILLTKNADDYLNRFIWMLPFDSETIINENDWVKGPTLLCLDTGQVTLTIYSYVAGSELDEIVLLKQEMVSEKKPSFYAVANLASVWDGRWIRDTSIYFSAESVNVPDTAWDELRLFTFLDTITGNYGIAYWLGIPPYDDNYPDFLFSLTINVSDEIQQAEVIDFRDGSQSVVNHTATDSTITIDNLIISDVPRLLILEKVTTDIPDIKSSFCFLQSYPNPLQSGQANIIFQLFEPDFVTLKIYDVLQKEVKTLVNRNLNAGIHNISFYADNLPDGVYFIALTTNSNSQTIKIEVIK